MNRLFAIILLLFSCNHSTAPFISDFVVISYSSQCCGVPSDKPLLSAIKQFKRAHNIKVIKGAIITNIGDEGEIEYVLNLQPLNEKQKNEFIKELYKLTKPRLLFKEPGSVGVNESHVKYWNELQTEKSHRNIAKTDF
ncbi:hypothetical protein D3C87_357960 [compost metagenome]